MAKAETTFYSVGKADIKDKIDVEVGDSKQTKFFPQVKLMRWDNEVNLSARLVDTEKQTVEGKNWSTDTRSAKFYDIEPCKEFPDGGYEFEITLKEKPATNVVEFTLETKGLEFFYQPATKGVIRPDNVVGSYAVYYKDCPINIKGGKEYKCGKAFHIYRPRIEDSEGNWTWGALNIDNKIMTVTIPQKFLDTAVYPVTHAAGLTIGYTSAGASYAGYIKDLRGGKFTSGVAGTLDSISAYLVSAGIGIAWSDLEDDKFQFAVYEDGTAGDKVAVSTEYTALGSESDGFLTLDLNDESISATTDYWLYAWGDNGAGWDAPLIKADTTGGDNRGSVSSGTYNTWADDLDDDDFDTNGSYKVSIYATYTASSSTPSGGSDADIEIEPDGAGEKLSENGSDADVDVEADGAGTKIASNGSDIEIIVTAVGAGTASIEGGSDAEIVLTSVGAGLKTAENGADVEIEVEVDGTGQKLSESGSNAPLILTPSGVGLKSAENGSDSEIIVTAVGAGEVLGIHIPTITASQVDTAIHLEWSVS